MTLTPHEVAVSQLEPGQTIPVERIKSLRFIKNNIIGNKTKKDLYIQLGIVSRLQDIISARDEKDQQLKTQAIIVLGSFAFGNENNILALTSSGVIEPLLICLNPNGDPKLIEAAARTLNAIYSSPKVSRQELFMGNHLNTLVQLLDTYSSNHQLGQEIAMLHTAELVASILARCCETPDQQMQIAASGAIPLLMRLLISGISKSQEAALGALAALVKDNSELARLIAQMRLERDERPAPYILRLVWDKSPSMRLAAATCLTYMNRAGVIQEHNSDIMSTVLPILVKMLQLSGPVQEAAPKVLAHLIWESETMQKAVCDMDAIPKLASIISQMDEEDNVYGIVGQKDKLKELLSDSDPGVLSSATATLCNIVLYVSPMKKSIMERGIVAKFVQMIGYGDNVVRLNAVWAIKNLVFEADPDVKETVMRQFGYHNLARLLNDDELAIQEQALNLVRNLVCKKEQDIDQVFNGLGHGQLLGIIEDKLTWDDQRLLEHALYVLANIATGSEYHKQSIMKRPAILKYVLGLMSHESAAIRVASIWVFINLTWPDEKINSGVHERVTQLRSLGVEDRLQSLNSDHNLDVRDRVKTALHHFLSDQQHYGHNGSVVSDSRHSHGSRNASHSITSQDSHTASETFGNTGMDTASAVSGTGASGHERR
ncbi:hypothetical protein BGX27_011284 [Mortierella sp. AM989]|nr:hypothetical protein BGX27_011284 [Mortierella sp. AM989]